MENFGLLLMFDVCHKVTVYDKANDTASYDYLDIINYLELYNL